MNVLAHRAVLTVAATSRRARVRPGVRGLGEERRRPLEWFATLFDASPAAISFSTLAEGCIFHVNDRFLEMLGYGRREGLGRTATGGILASLKLQLDGVAGRLPDEVPSLLALLSSRVRDLAMDLRPPILDEIGLVPTLLWHFERYHAQTGIRVDFQQSAPVGRLPPPVETAAFRIVQEALTNVARHAAVQEASVRLDDHPDAIVLRVEDRGLGFRPESAWAGASSGLAGMRDRARLAGGRLTIDSAPGVGTRLRAELPHTEVEGRAG